MAITPLFITDMDTLKSELRLTGSSQADTAVMIDRAVQEVRAGFYSKVGAAQIALIIAMTPTENPTTDDGITRLKAANAEILWTRLRLIQTLPTLFMDSSGQTNQVWNEEGLTRDSSSGDIGRMTKDIEEQLFELLDDLAGTGEPGTASVLCIGPTETPPRPGESAFPWGYS